MYGNFRVFILTVISLLINFFLMGWQPSTESCPACRAGVCPAPCLSAACLHTPVIGFGWLSQLHTCRLLVTQIQDINNSNHTLRGHGALFQEWWHSKMQLGWLHFHPFVSICSTCISGYQGLARGFQTPSLHYAPSVPYASTSHLTLSFFFSVRRWASWEERAFIFV